MPFVRSGILEIKLFGSDGTCCDYLSVRLIHFPAAFFLSSSSSSRKKEENTQNCSGATGTLNWLRIERRKKCHNRRTNASRHVEPECFFLDENQYLIMQLSIRKLLSAGSCADLLTGHQTWQRECSANKAVKWNSRLLLFDLWTENNHPF